MNNEIQRLAFVVKRLALDLAKLHSDLASLSKKVGSMEAQNLHGNLPVSGDSGVHSGVGAEVPKSAP